MTLHSKGHVGPGFQIAAQISRNKGFWNDVKWPILLLLLLSTTAAEKISIATSFYPTQYMALRIAGDLANVVNLVPFTDDPIFYRPTRKDILALQQSDVILLNGASFEKWVDKVTLPDTRVVHTAKVLKDDYLSFTGAVTHSHGSGDKHSHEGRDGHTWVDPLNFIKQAEAVKNALVKRYPRHEKAFTLGFKGIKLDFESLHQEFSKISQSRKPPALLMSHPAYNYIAKRYAWKIQNLDLDPQEMPSEETMARIKTLNKKFRSRYLIWESKPKPEIAARLQKELGLKSLVFSPCEQLSDTEIAEGNNYLQVMRKNLEVIRILYKR